MTIILPALGVAFPAVCIWLAVRIFNRREKWAKRTAVGLAVATIFFGAYATAYACMVRSSLPERLRDAVGIIGKIELVPDYTGSYLGLKPAYFIQTFFGKSQET